jgi:hypothetical protein
MLNNKLINIFLLHGIEDYTLPSQIIVTVTVTVVAVTVAVTVVEVTVTVTVVAVTVTVVAVTVTVTVVAVTVTVIVVAVTGRELPLHAPRPNHSPPPHTHWRIICLCNGIIHLCSECG